MNSQSNHAYSLDKNAHVVRPKCTAESRDPSKANLSLGTARLLMANERQSPCLGMKDNAPYEMPGIIIAALVAACASGILILAFVVKLAGI